MIEDQEIMRSVREGDTHKLGQLFDRHAQGLFNYFRFQVRDRFKSEDLVQNVFYKILKYKHTYKDGADFKVWMYAIARNEKINHFKSNKFMGEEIGPEQSDDWDRNPEKDLENKTDKHQLTRALGMISSENRELIILSKYTGLPYRQIAELFDCTVGNIKVRVCRAIKELRAQYLNIAGELKDGL